MHWDHSALPCLPCHTPWIFHRGKDETRKTKHKLGGRGGGGRGGGQWRKELGISSMTLLSWSPCPCWGWSGVNVSSLPAFRYQRAVNIYKQFPSARPCHRSSRREQGATCPSLTPITLIIEENKSLGTVMRMRVNLLSSSETAVPVYAFRGHGPTMRECSEQRADGT